MRTNPRKIPGKLMRMLALFSEGKRLHRFDAYRLGDSCLNTTVSDIQIRHGIFFCRKSVKVPNGFGGETPVMLYWLGNDALAKSKVVLSAKGVI